VSNNYHAFGLLIRSEFDLPELGTEPVADRAPDVVIHRGKVPRHTPRITLDEEVALQHPGAGFLIRGGCDVTVDIRADIDPPVLRALLLGRVMAFVFRQRGWLPLHASGVLVDNECILFLGNVRAGKSTTAAAFHQQGHPVVTDDVAPVRVDSDGRCILQSAWSYVRLHSDAAAVLAPRDCVPAMQGGKHRFDLDQRDRGGVYVVRCAYAIEFGDNIAVESLNVMRAMPLLSRYCFVRHKEMTREALESHVRACTAVAGSIPVRRLSRPRSLAALPDLVRFVRRDLAPLPDAQR